MSEDLPEKANVGITELAQVLKNLFGKYEQATKLEDAEKVGSDLVVLPIMAFEPARINLQSKSIKNTFCVARYFVYAKKREGEEPCARFIFASSCESREEVLKKMPGPIHDAYFDKEGENTLADLLTTLGGIKSDKISYFYEVVNCEGVNTHCMAVVHEFCNEEGEAYCTATAYLTISVGK